MTMYGGGNEKRRDTEREGESVEGRKWDGKEKWRKQQPIQTHIQGLSDSISASTYIFHNVASNAVLGWAGLLKMNGIQVEWARTGVEQNYFSIIMKY